MLAFSISLQLHKAALQQRLAASGLLCKFRILYCRMQLWLAAGASMHLTQTSKSEARPGQLFRVARLDPEASMLNERRLQAGDSQQLLHLPKPVMSVVPEPCRPPIAYCRAGQASPGRAADADALLGLSTPSRARLLLCEPLPGITLSLQHTCTHMSACCTCRSCCWPMASTHRGTG